MFALTFGLVEKARAMLQVQAQRPCTCFFSLRISDFESAGSRARELYPSGAFLKIKMPTRGRHFFRRLGPEVPSWLRDYSSSSSSSSKKVKSSSSSSTSPRSLNVWRVRHSIITHTKTEITRPASTRMPTPANDSKKKWYSDSMLMTIFLSFR